MIFKFKQDNGYSPLFFLASLGSGGLAISFFMYLLFVVPHPGTPIPTHEHLWEAFNGSSLYMSILVVVALIGILIFYIQNLALLGWNINQYVKFRKTDAYRTMRSTNAEVQLMAIPLALAMTVNVSFVAGAVFVPDLWGAVEKLFPIALIAFGLIGVYALKIFLEFFGRLLADGGFDFGKNNSLSQMLSVFAFSMIAVGFSASGAMSKNETVSIIGILLATAFISIALLLLILKLILGFHSMLSQGINKEAAVSLWILIPILTILGIAYYRITMGLYFNFDASKDNISNLLLFTSIFSLQLFFGFMGHAVMKRLNYYDEFISGKGKSAVAYAAVCPGVALFVMSNFLINKGLVASGMVEQFSVVYLALYIPLIWLQLKTILVFWRLTYRA